MTKNVSRRAANGSAQIARAIKKFYKFERG